jgi:tetratricopeptide (TPR) repeat protein
MSEASIEQSRDLAVRHHQAGRLTDAEVIYRQILTQHPNRGDVIQLLGTLLGQRGDLAAGETMLRQALAIDPTNAAAYFNLGEMCRRQGRAAEALATIMEGIRYRPNGSAYLNLSAALRDLRFDRAADDALRVAARFDPKISVQPTPQPRPTPSMDQISDARVCVALSATLTQLHHYDDAIKAAERTIELQPKSGDPLVNLGWLYAIVGQRADAIAACTRAIALDPNNGPAHWNMALVHLLQGEFAIGWELHEWRKRCVGFNLPRHHQPPWTGQSLAGNRILLWYEQGLGDTIQFVRYVPKIAAMGAQIILSIQPELRRLLEASFTNITFHDPRSPSPDCDYQCGLFSLPYVFKTDLASIPADTPYVKPPAELVEIWKQKIGPATSSRRIGLAWAGRVGHLNDANRSIPADVLTPLGQAGATFFSLQKWRIGMGATAPAFEMVDLTAELADMADTAALIANLDLVVAVDTAVAHLAGAIGKPVWLLLPKNPDWRWLLDREDSPWYPTMRLFRQPTLGDWQTPIGRVAQLLKDK